MNRCCQSLVVFSSTIIRSKSKEKGKGRGCGKYLKKKQHKEFTITYCRRCVLMIGNRISGDMYNELFRESNQHKNAIKNCPIALQTFSFLSLSLCILYFLFHKGKDTSAIPEPSVQHLVYVFPISFLSHKCFNNFHFDKNILINKSFD